MPEVGSPDLGATPGDAVLLLAIVQREDAAALVDEITRRGHRATRIAAVGGFLRAGNDVVLVGVAPGLVSDILAAVQATCRTRTAYVTSPAGDPSISIVEGLIGPIEVEVGGALVFAAEVERLYRLRGRRAPVGG